MRATTLVAAVLACAGAQARAEAPVYRWASNVHASGVHPAPTTCKALASRRGCISSPLCQWVRDAASCEARTAAGTDNANVEALVAPHILVVWSSQTNHTKNLAAAIAKGAGDAGGSVRLKHVTDATFAGDVKNWSDCIVIGSPTHFGNPASDLLAWVEMDWEGGWIEGLADKKGAVFATGGGIAQGVEHVVSALIRTLWSFRIKVLTPDPTRSGYDSYGAVAVTGTPPFNRTGGAIAEDFAEAGEILGRNLVIETAADLATRHLLSEL